MRMVTVLRNESYTLKLDQNSKLDSISVMLSDLASKTNKLREELSLGTSRVEIALNKDALQQTLSSLFTSYRVEHLSTGISQLALTEQELGDVANEQAVMRSLNFSSRPVRHENIPVAHERTFRWMIDPSDESGETEHLFLDWLKSGYGIFWVSGKAGSGKSTLMKFLADHETTTSMLEEWANPMKLVIATHYFWSAGTAMQKSYGGLFRTLLYEIFRICPALIPQVCPVRWAQMNSGRLEKDTDWTISELLGTLHALSRHSNLPVRYCFFIDGIDEFDGDHSKLCEILTNFSRSQNIKLCLASRPWNVFIDAFGTNPIQKICIEDLTRNDIRRYAQSQLMEHPRWHLSYFRTEDKQSIINDITSKAQGVFLWVFLVTKSLRDGLTNDDTLLDLRNRLESLPTALEPFFKHMLELVDAIYHEKMASFLRIAVNANRPLPFLIYSMHEHEYEDQEYAVKMPISPLSEGEMEMLQNQCRRRVNARCGGLLDVKSGSVEFLHRTVRDFLFTREMSDYLGTKTKPGFSPNLSTLRAYVATLKRSPQLTSTTLRDATTQTLLGESLQYASEAIEETEGPAIELLDNLEDLYLAPLEGNDSLLEWNLVIDAEPENYDGNANFRDHSLGYKFREELLQAGVDKYISWKLRESQNYFDNLDIPPLSVVINVHNWTIGHMHTIRELLQSGQDPNAGHNAEPAKSPWTSFILRTCREEYRDDFNKAIEMGLFSLFLNRGASRDAYIDDPHVAEIPKENIIDDIQLETPDMPSSCFVKALFSQYPKHPNKSLRVLEELLDSSLGTDICPAVLCTLKGELKKINLRATRADKLRLFAEITEKVVNAGVSMGWEMGFMLPHIERVFPGAIGSRIKYLLEKRDIQDSEMVSRKRNMEIDIFERMTKRAKISRPDHPVRDPVLPSIFNTSMGPVERSSQEGEFCSTIRGSRASLSDLLLSNLG